MADKAPGNFDAYCRAFPRRVQDVLKRIRAAVRRVAPQAEETISYRMPAFKQQGVLLYFAAFREHIGVYPPVRGDAALSETLAPFAGEKGNLRFPLDAPMRYDLIERIVALRLRQNLAKGKAAERPRRVKAAASDTCDAEQQIDAFLAKYTAPIAAEMRAVRQRLHKLFPRGCELVYDNYNALAIGYGPSDRAGEAIVSFAGYPKWVTLFLLHGASVPDPDKLLAGSGTRVRNLRLRDAAQLDEAPVRRLLARALAPHQAALRQAEPLRTLIKSVSAKQRTRRPATRGMAER